MSVVLGRIGRNNCETEENQINCSRFQNRDSNLAENKSHGANGSN